LYFSEFADGFFIRYGYTLLNRDAAPKSITRTAQFSQLCPGDAKLLSKRLDD